MKTTQVKPSELLQSIADILLANPEMHTKLQMARNEINSPCHALSVVACQWCSIGLLDVGAHDLDKDHAHSLYTNSKRYFERANHIEFLTKFNDAPSRTVEEIQNAFQKAADLAVMEKS